jgi:hypothetical protein
MIEYTDRESNTMDPIGIGVRYGEPKSYLICSFSSLTKEQYLST